MNNVVLDSALAVAIVVRVKRQEATIEHLRLRLADRDALLARALQELAVYRLEKDPEWFIYQRSTRSRSLNGSRSAREKPSPAPEEQGAA